LISSILFPGSVSRTWILLKSILCLLSFGIYANPPFPLYFMPFSLCRALSPGVLSLFLSLLSSLFSLSLCPFFLPLS
jgi:hypothetical protein